MGDMCPLYPISESAPIELIQKQDIFRFHKQITLFSRFFFLIFYNTVMIYNTRNRSNDTTESQKEKKICFDDHFHYSQSRIAGLK